MTALKNINMLPTVGMNEKLWCVIEKIYMNYFKGRVEINNKEEVHGLTLDFRKGK